MRTAISLLLLPLYLILFVGFVVVFELHHAGFALIDLFTPE